MMSSIRRVLDAAPMRALPSLMAALVFSLAHAPQAAADLEKTRNRLYEKAMTPKALAKCEARLNQLKPGQTMTAEACGLQLLSLEGQGEKDVIAVADGWIPSLSGGVEGAAYMLGRYSGRDSAFVWGEHWFGYVSEGATLVPKYRVITRAALISDADYASRKTTSSIGAIPAEGLAQPLHFGDPVFVEKRDIAGTDLSGASKGKRVEIKDFAKVQEELCSESKYQEAQQLMDAVPVGSHFSDMWAKLGTIVLTIDYGQNFGLLMKGYLREDPFAPWVLTTSKARYEVWTFGTMIDGKANPLRTVVFRNCDVERIQPFAPREELAKTLE